MNSITISLALSLSEPHSFELWVVTTTNCQSTFSHSAFVVVVADVLDDVLSLSFIGPSHPGSGATSATHPSIRPSSAAQQLMTRTLRVYLINKNLHKFANEFASESQRHGRLCRLAVDISPSLAFYSAILLWPSRKGFIGWKIKASKL